MDIELEASAGLGCDPKQWFMTSDFHGRVWRSRNDLDPCAFQHGRLEGGARAVLVILPGPGDEEAFPVGDDVGTFAADGGDTG